MRRHLAITAILMTALVLLALALGVAPPTAGPAAPRPGGAPSAERLAQQLSKERVQHRAERPRLYAAGYARAKREFVYRPDVRQMIRTVAIAFGIPPEQHLARAKCESNLDPDVVNPASGTTGLFQFMLGTWTGQTRVGAAGLSRTDPLANTLGAAEMIADGQQQQWDCGGDGTAKSRGGGRIP